MITKYGYLTKLRDEINNRLEESFGYSNQMSPDKYNKYLNILSVLKLLTHTPSDCHSLTKCQYDSMKSVLDKLIPTSIEQLSLDFSKMNNES